MPIKVKESRRVGNQPFVYFEGKREELSTAEIPDIVGRRLFGDGEGRQGCTLKLRSSILAAVADLEKGGKMSGLVPVEAAGGDIVLRVRRRPDGSVLIHQQPVAHEMYLGGFQAFKGMLKDGFRGFRIPNVSISEKRKAPYFTDVGFWEAGITKGDRYGVELMAPVTERRPESAHVKDALPGQILRANIFFAKGLPADQAEAKKRFYKKELEEFGIPIYFGEYTPHRY